MRYSEEREAILDYVNKNKNHPTAHEIYEDLKQKYPKLSLGTVYRNLNQLVEYGKLIRIAAPNDRFDATIKKHFHALCLKCGTVKDIMNLEAKLDEAIYESMGFKVTSHNLLLKGYCKKCLKEVEQWN